MREDLKTPAFWIEPSFIEHASGERVNLAPQYLTAEQVRAYRDQLTAHNYTLIDQPNGDVYAYAPKRVSESLASLIVIRPVAANTPLTPEQQLAYAERSTDQRVALSTAD